MNNQIKFQPENVSEYFEGWMKMRALLLQDQVFRLNAGQTMRKIYIDNLIDDPALNIVGQGYSHIIISIQSEQDIPIALRLRYHRNDNALREGQPVPYKLDDLLAEQMGAYEKAFLESLNPPRFVGVLTIPDEKDKLACIVTEDLSAQGKTVLLSNPGQVFGLRLSDRLRFFIDPDPEFEFKQEHLNLGRKYLQADLTIELIN